MTQGRQVVLVLALLVLLLVLVVGLVSQTWSLVIISGGFLLYGATRLWGPHRTPTAQR